MKKFFIRVPDSPGEIKAKITFLENDVEKLKAILKRNQKDLLINHLFYDDKRIMEKKRGLEETAKLIKSKELKISILLKRKGFCNPVQANGFYPRQSRNLELFLSLVNHYLLAYVQEGLIYHTV